MYLNSTAFSDVSYEPATRLLTMIWKKQSNQLDENGVKSELNVIIRYIKEYGIRNVIIDSREYSFRTNVNLQTWLTRTYIPQIMDSSINRYAIVVSSGLIIELRTSEPEVGVFPMVDYFASMADAKQWILLG